MSKKCVISNMTVLIITIAILKPSLLPLEWLLYYSPLIILVITASAQGITIYLFNKEQNRRNISERKIQLNTLKKDFANFIARLHIIYTTKKDELCGLKQEVSNDILVENIIKINEFSTNLNFVMCNKDDAKNDIIKKINAHIDTITNFDKKILEAEKADGNIIQENREKVYSATEAEIADFRNYMANYFDEKLDEIESGKM